MTAALASGKRHGCRHGVVSNFARLQSEQTGLQEGEKGVQGEANKDEVELATA